MTQVVNDGEFWLPPHVLTEDNVVMKMNNAVGSGAVWRNLADVKLDVPRKEFPYEFGFRSEVSSPVESLDNTESEEEDFFAELTQRLTLSESRKVSPLDLYKPAPEVQKVSRGSPQSILGGIGSWSGRSSNGSNHSPLQSLSPPATPYEAEYDTWGLIRAAAGQVERLKFNAENPMRMSPSGQFRETANSEADMNHIPQLQNNKANFFAEQQNYMAAARIAHNAALLREQRLQILARSVRHNQSSYGVAPELSAQTVWPPLQRPQQYPTTMPARANIQAVSVPKKESVGTGVFLPRRYNPAPAAPPRKRTVSSNALVPAKVVQALNLSFEEMNARSQPHYSAYAASLSQQNYEALMARRNAFLAQQQRIVARADDHAQSRIDLEVCLPQEWSY
ncbi:unnamed protein product [Rhodiola kirilowii]